MNDDAKIWGVACGLCGIVQWLPEGSTMKEMNAAFARHRDESGHPYSPECEYGAAGMSKGLHSEDIIKKRGLKEGLLSGI